MQKKKEKKEKTTTTLATHNLRHDQQTPSNINKA